MATAVFVCWFRCPVALPRGSLFHQFWYVRKSRSNLYRNVFDCLKV